MRAAGTRLGAAALVVVAFVVVAVIARSTPSHTFGVRPHASGANSLAPISVSAGSSLRSTSGHGGQPQLANGVTTAVVVAVLGFALVVLLLQASRLRVRIVRVRRWRRRGATHAAAGPTVAPHEAMATAVDETLDLLSDRQPVADGIIQAWIHVEQALGAAGMPVRASETSSEYVDRALRALGVEEIELRHLAALYREARFSEHDLDEAKRTAARRCLGRIRDDLARRSRSGAHES